VTHHRTATRQEWLSARLELLDAEKRSTRGAATTWTFWWG
jgi:predicted dithiol-disulfide oxidoreductase (DUF899 family)